MSEQATPLWLGKPPEDLTREELIEAVRYLYGLLEGERAFYDGALRMTERPPQ